MKILQVAPYYAPSFGGAAEVVFHLCKNLAARGHQVTVYASDYKLTDDYLKAAPQVKVIAFKTRSSIANFFYTPGMDKKIRQDIKDFDVIHLHNYRSYQNVVARRYALTYGIPYVLGTYGSLPNIAGKALLKQLYDIAWGRKLVRDAARCIAMTPAEIEQYKALGQSGDRVTMVPNSIDIEAYEKLPEKGTFRKQYNITEEDLILFLGRIHPIKGIDILVKAASPLLKNQSNTRLVIIGPDEGYLPALKALIKELDITEKVTITGFIPAELKAAAYTDAAMYVLPSIYESFPTTVLEAAACGTPVIVTDRCQIAPLVDNVFGLVVPYDVEKLREGVARLLADKALRARLGEKGRAEVKAKYTREQTVKQVEAIYDEVVKPRRG